MNTYVKFCPNVFFGKSAMKSTKKEKLLRLQPSTVMRTKVSSLISSLRKTDFLLLDCTG